ncbi:hypothetical protein ABZW30_44425 [Kitasatospora sp. NPDC004669]|uniref:hypothetical protein n=1 Tax=Kitasatospora sp. NPDC004669 TaxID=3154555 RepID=UPI0033AE6651
MTAAQETVDPKMLRQLEDAAGDYLADVAELLLTAGYPIGNVLLGMKEAAWTEPLPKNIDNYLPEGVMHFPDDVARRFNFNGQRVSDLGLWWSYLTGWQISAGLDRTTVVNRWMGSGLTPDPKAVAAFFNEAVTDLASAGHGEHRLYRNPGTDLPGLLARLRDVAGIERRQGLHRIDRLRFLATWNHATGAILTDDTPARITVTGGELRALQYLVDFYVAHGLEEDAVRDFARTLVQDLQARAAANSPAVPLRAHARHYAKKHS